jgi:hypothetical protein
MKQSFAAIILGGTGQVGGAAVAELLAIPECRQVVMVTRKPVAPRPRVRTVVLDTSAADFAERAAALAREVLSQGPVSAVSCVGLGSGSSVARREVGEVTRENASMKKLAAQGETATKQPLTWLWGCSIQAGNPPITLLDSLLCT